MERYVLVPDSFKGTLTSREICEILREEILRNAEQTREYFR